MKIYTSYLAKAKRVLDANMIPVAIVRYLPAKVNMNNVITLAPSAPLLRAYKNDNNADAYTKKFNEYLTTLDAESLLKELESISTQNDNKDIVLICYEKSANFCHRHLVANWLNKSNLLSHKITELNI